MPEKLNVKFLKGTQASLNTLIGSSGDRFQAGAFYLTEDTDRLYFAQHADELVPLNQFIRTVTNAQFTALTSANVAIGDYYYIEESNILAICKTTSGGTGGTPTWTQLNPDTNTTYDFNVSEDTNGALLTIQPSTNGVTGTRDDILFKEGNSWIKIDKGSSGQTIEIKHSSAISGAVGVASAQTGAFGATFNVLRNVEWDAAGHITKVESGTVALPSNPDTDTKSALSTDGLNVNLTETNKSGALVRTDTIIISADSGLVASATAAVSGTHNGKITIKHGSKPSTGPALTPGGATGTITNDRKFSALTGITLDSYGHVATATLSTFTLPVDNDTVVTSVSAGSDGKITIKRYNNGTGTTVADVVSGADLYYTATFNDDASATTIYNKGSFGHLVTKDYMTSAINNAVESYLRDFDAMEYQGTAATSASLVTGDVHKGDTWKASAGFTIPAASSTSGQAETVKVGDLIIAQGTENASGVIASPKFDIVPAGNEPTYAFSGDSSTKTLKLDETLGGVTTQTGTLKFKGDTWISPALSVSGNALEVTYSHAGPSTGSALTPTAENSAGLAYGGTFTAVVGVLADTKGHITGVKTKEFELPAALDTTHRLSVISTGIRLDRPNNAQDDIAINDGAATSGTNDVVVTKTVASGNSRGSITIAHKSYAAPSSSSATGVTTNYSGVISAITGITTSNGHVTGYTVTPYTLPAKVTYTIDNTVTATNNVASVTYGLTGGSTSSAAFGISSTNETIEVTATNKEINLEIVWGSF